MKRIITFVLSFVLVAGFIALNEESVSAQEHADHAVAGDDTVDVDDEGTEFDPKVEVSELPPGAWYCDMNGVHYARMDKGDGKCELCGMKLQQKDDDEHDHGGHHH